PDHIHWLFDITDTSVKSICLFSKSIDGLADFIYGFQLSKSSSPFFVTGTSKLKAGNNSVAGTSLLPIVLSKRYLPMLLSITWMLTTLLLFFFFHTNTLKDRKHTPEHPSSSNKNY